jgi:hypothetical protein
MLVIPEKLLIVAYNSIQKIPYGYDTSEINVPFNNS